VPAAVPKGENRHLFEIIFRQPNFPVEDGDYMLVIELGRLRRIRSVAFQAERVDFFSAQQVLVLAAVWLMARPATFLKRRLVQVLLFALLCLIRVARQANFHAVCLRQSRHIACVRTMAIRAVARSAGMLHFRAFYLLDLLRVTRCAELLGAGLSQNDFAVLRWLMADFALLFAKRQVDKPLHQLWPVRLVGVMASQTIGFLERLVLVGLSQGVVFRVVAVEAQSWRRLRQVKLKFAIGSPSRFVVKVAAITTRIEGQMPAASFIHIDSDAMTSETKIALPVARRRLQQLILVVGSVRIVALQAIAKGRPVNDTLDSRRILVSMAFETQGSGRCGNQLHSRHISAHANLVTANTSRRDGSMHALSFVLVPMAFQALGRICFLVQRSSRACGRSQWWPHGIYDLVTQITREYNRPIIEITEEGCSYLDTPYEEENGHVPDARRTQFFREHLAELARAISDGANVRAYHAWSLLDNFEWADGYSQRYGLTYVDFRSQKRTIKDSGLWYGRVAATNRLGA